MSIAGVAAAPAAAADEPVHVQRDARRRWYLGSAVGGLLATLVFAWMVSAGTFSLLDRQFLGNFYDSQAHALLDGHWDVPAEDLTIEAFIVDGKAYTYFGPFPAIIRMPVAALTDRFDGRLTELSMLAAFVVALVGVARLSWRVRTLLRGDSPVGRFERVVAGATTFAVGTGSVLLFLGSRAWVYHEAIIWGVALTLLAYDQLVALAVQPSRRHLLLTAVFTALALLSRGSVAFGPVAALGLVLLARLAPRLRRPLGVSDGVRTLPVAAMVVALVVPVGLFAYVNTAKFGTPFRVPFDKQVIAVQDPVRKEALEANGGSLFGAKFLPTTALQYARPDALDVDRLFPWMTFKREPPSVVGDVVLLERELTSSVPSTMPALTILGVVGLLALVRRSRPRAAGPEAMRPVVLGAAVGCAAALCAAYLAQRYLGDLLPFVVVVGLVGLHVLLRPLDAQHGVRPWWRRPLGVGVVVLAAFSVFVNLGLSLVFQRLLSANDLDGELRRAEFVRFQHRLDDRLTGGSTPATRFGPDLPPPAPRDHLFVIDGCAGVYWSDGRLWHPVERTAATGEFRLRITPTEAAAGTMEPVLSTSTGDITSALYLERLGGDRSRFVYVLTGGLTFTYAGEPVRMRPGESYDVNAIMDRRIGVIMASVDGDTTFDLRYFVAQGGVTAVGVGPDGARFAGRIEEEPLGHPFCDRLVDGR